MKKKSRRQLRTAFLALFATVTFVWSAIFIFDVPTSTMLKLFLLSGMLVVLMAFAGLLFALLIYFVRHRDRSGRSALTKTAAQQNESVNDSPE